MRERDGQREQRRWSHETRGCVPFCHLPFPDLFMENTEDYLSYFFLTMWGMSSWPPTWFQNVNGVTIVHSVEMSESQRLSSWGTLFLYFIGANYFLKNAFYGHCSPHFWSLFRTESLERSYQSREVFSRFWKHIAKATSRKVIWFIFFSHYTFVASGAINLPIVFANLISKRLYLATAFNFSDYFFMAE